jgi:hypothetical protein
MTNSIVDLINSQRNNTQTAGIQQIKNLMQQMRNNQMAFVNNPTV